MRLLCIAVVCAFALPAFSLESMSVRDQAELVDRITQQRLTEELPRLMRRDGIDMWVIMSREYNEDPVLKTMLPSSWMAARRHTMLVIYDPDGSGQLEYLAVARYPMGDLFATAWDTDNQPDQWQALADLIVDRNPKKIAINTSDGFGLADGMSSTEYRKFNDILPESLQDRVISGEKLAIAWLETRSDLEMEYYPQLVALGHELIAEAFSNKVVEPGKTTTDDIVWWLRQRSSDMGLGNWFHPTVSLQRADTEEFDQNGDFSEPPGLSVTQPGDLLHVDFGITFLRLNTDQQQHAYILRPGETAAPAGLQEALKQANRLQDILTANFKVGRTGNEVLAMSLKMAQDEGIKPTIYTHPLGLHGHAAGPTIGRWDAQGGVPVQGDYPLYPNTAYSIELNAASKIPEWGKVVRIMLEEDAFFDGEQVIYLSGRQTTFHLIKSSGSATSPGD